MELQIARNGAVIRTLELETLAAEMANGSIFPTDFGWHEGMNDWKPVSELVPDAISHSRGKTPKQPKAKKDWRQDAATEKQIEFLKSFGVSPAPELKKGEASDLLDKCMKDPAALKFQNDKRYADMKAAMELRRKERAALGAYSFRADYEKAKAAYADEVKKVSESKAAISGKKKEGTSLRKKLQGADGDERELLEQQIEAAEFDSSDLEYDPIDLECLKEELKEAETIRLKFWKATFKADWEFSEDASEYDVLVDVGRTIDRLYDEYGQFFRTPTNKQTKDILESLDNASPDWDKAQPEAFFARLQKDSPGQMKVKAAARSSGSTMSRRKTAKGKGCLLMLTCGLSCLAALTWLLT